jgi:hypothetical protein
MTVMRSTAFHKQPATTPVLGSMVWLAVGSFAIGFGGYLLFGLNLV